MAIDEHRAKAAAAAAAEKAAQPPPPETSFRLGNNYALHSASFAVRPERRLTRSEAWAAARASPLKATVKAAADVVVGLGTFVVCTVGTLLIGIGVGAYTTEGHSGPRARRLTRQHETELARLRAAAGPPSLDGPIVMRHDTETEQDDVGFAGSA